MSNDPKVTTCVVEVSGLAGKAVMRLTEAGALPLVNGARVQLPIDVARQVVERSPDNCKIIGNGPAGIEKEKLKDEPAGFTFKVLSGEADSVNTEKTAETSAEGKASNKSMAGKTQTK